MDGQGNLERIWKVREKSGNLKINCYGSIIALSTAGIENLFILFKRGKDYILMRWFALLGSKFFP